MPTKRQIVKTWNESGLGWNSQTALNEKRIRNPRPMKSPVFYGCRVNRNGSWFPAKSMEKVSPDGRIKMDIRIGAVNVRAYIKPEHIECLNDDWYCLSCGRINGKDYSNCNGCGKGRP